MGTSYAPNIVKDGLVFYVDAANQRSYPGTGTTLYDLKGSSNGTMSGPSGTNNSPQFDSSNGGCIDFDDNDDRVSFGNDSSIQIFTDSHSQSYWINASSVSEGYIGGYGITSVVIFYGDGRIRFYTSGLSSGTDFFSTTSLSANIWYNICCTYESSGDKKIYINGISDNSTSTSGNITNTGGVDFIIGARNNSGTVSHFYGGKIAPAQLYNRALSASEVKQNYNALKGRFGL